MTTPSVSKTSVGQTWPFPPPSGPVPWTAKQIKQYQQEQRDKMPEAPF